MNEQERTVLRLMARHRGQALRSRSASTLAPDPGNAVGIVPIKVVTEEVIQAIAYGRLNGRPTVLARLNPMSRDASDLESFGQWLVAYVTGEIAAGRCPRVWLPHSAALDCLDILGHRYINNREALEALREMGRMCRILSEEARYEGQQAVVVALDLLKEHVVTGQMSIEDNHLGAMLAWVDPEPGRSPIEVAGERARKAASGILVNTPDQPDDDTVENARRIYKRGSGGDPQRAAARIRGILEAAALREWCMLVAARNAFWNLGVDVPPHVALVGASRKRLATAVQEGFWTPRRAHTLSIRLEEYEDAAGAKNAAVVAADPFVQDAETRRGRIVAAVVRQVQQPKRSCRPCEITLETDQSIVRLRREDRVRSLDGSFTAVVRGIGRDPATGNRVISLELTKGFRSTGVLSIGSTHRWTADGGYPLALRAKALHTANQRGGWLISGDTPPVLSPRFLTGGDPLELAQRARRHP